MCSTASSVPLRGRTFHIAVRAEDAAIPSLRLHHHAACLALIKILARVLGHNLALAMPARWTRYRRPNLRHRSSSTTGKSGEHARRPPRRLGALAFPSQLGTKKLALILLSWKAGIRSHETWPEWQQKRSQAIGLAGPILHILGHAATLLFKIRLKESTLQFRP